MKRTTLPRVHLIPLIGVALALGLLGCGRGQEPVEEASAEPDSVIHVPTTSLASGDVVVASVIEETVADTVVVAGQVQPMPLNIAHVSTRVSGTIQAVQAVLGDRVAKGQVLATLYCPEFLAAEGDYLLAHERAEAAQGAAPDDVVALQGIARSARQRLELLGAGADDLARLDRTHEAFPSLALRSPIAGVITEVQAGVGKQVPSGTDLFGIVNLREVWAVVDAYERDLGRLRVGQAATVEATAFPGERFRGRVASLEGAIKEATRTLDVRLKLANPDLKLKPGMFVTARIATGVTRRAVVLDEGAVQAEGDTKIVYVALTDSTFAPRSVEVRPLGGNRSEIVRGLRLGERIAVRGAFLLKSQARKSQLGEE